VELTRRMAWGVRVWIDDDGVTRRGLLSRRTMRWDEVDDYRIVARIPRGSVLIPLDELIRFTASVAGEGRLAYAIELRSGERRLRIDSFFARMPRVIGDVLARVGDRLADRARADLRETGTARFGPLRLAPHAVQWGDREPLPRQRVEAIDLLDTSPVRLRVMERGRVLPHAAAPTRNIPALHAALAVARELGYPVRDGEVVRVLDARS
jgi:hypothetical protein